MELIRVPKRAGAPIRVPLRLVTVDEINSAVLLRSADSPVGRLVTLLADAQLTDHFAVAIRIVALQVVQQATALGDQHEQAAA